MKNRNFRQDEFNKFDKIGREFCHEFLSDSGFTSSDNPNKYEVDILYSNAKGEEFGIDAEVRPMWKSSCEFPFSTIHVPCRKSKYMKDKDSYFVSSSDCKRALVFSWEKIMTCPKVGEYADGFKEPFFDVPKKFGVNVFRNEYAKKV